MSLDLDKTIAYYNQHAAEYFSETVKVDLGEQRDVFLSVLPSGGQIMDLGCGSGRDSRYFLEKGFTVEALDASRELCKLAQQFTGIPVQCCTIQEWVPEKTYDGIWACASLLHLKREKLKDFFKNCHRFLKKDGVLFVSAKEEIQTGTDEKERFFTNFDETLIRELVYEDSCYEMLRLWRTQDGLGRETKWINLLVRNKR
jgi:cyclopropane fatty-acyl-phospholipid synthase-like methyltransferase